MHHWLDYLKAGLGRELPQDRISEDSSSDNLRELLISLRPFIAQHWQPGLIGSILTLFASLLSFAQPLVSRFMVDDVILAKRIDLLPLAVLMLGGLYLLNQGSSMLQHYYFMHFEQGVMLDIQENLIEHTLRLPKSFFDEKEIGYLISRISSDVDRLRWFFSGTLVFIFTNIIRFIGGVAFVFYLEWRLAVVTVIVLPALVVSVRYFSNRLHALSHQGMEQRANVLHNLQEALSSIPLIKAFSSETRASGRIMDEIRASRQISMEQSVVSSFANLIIESAPTIAKAIVYIAGAYLAIRGEWTLGSLLAFQSYLGYVYGPAMFFAHTNLQFQDSRAALERVSALFNIVPEENLDTGYQVERFNGDVQFENVYFSYNGTDIILENISFHIQPGEHIAVVGPSGVGKTTLISLLLYFYRPTKGDILFDGKSASLYKLSSLRKRIGYRKSGEDSRHP
jgi:ABC-type bacteriocin/lantibiotic exporter with double-glycine peptidase domain